MVGVKTRCMPVITSRARAPHDGHRQPAQVVVDRVDQAGDGGANPDADGADEEDGQRRRDQHDQHGFEEVLGDRRGDAVDPALDVGEAPGHHQRRNDGVGVFDRGHRDQGESHLLPFGGSGHQLDEAGVHQHACDGDGQGHVGLELDGGGGGHHQGQEEEGPIPGHREDGEGRGAFLQHAAGHLQHHGQQLEHGAADDGRDEGDMVPIRASRMAAPMRRRLQPAEASGSGVCPPPWGSRASTSR